jgi:3-methyladenine DNA glycosylase/8-oxoguanine DNA glycosylase
MRSHRVWLREPSRSRHSTLKVIFPTDEVAERLLALPGIGPYGATHLMMLVGRHSRLVLDSWTRPKYAQVSGRKASDAAVERCFRRYGRYSGLAFWLYLTKDWVPG